MPLEWNDAYKVDHDEMDAQHQQLFTRVNDFLGAKDQDRLTASAIELSRYTREHLAYEEVLMRSWRYPESTEHSTQHENLLSLLDNVMENLSYESLNRVDLDAFLTDWLLIHIATADQRLAIHIAFSGG